MVHLLLGKSMSRMRLVGMLLLIAMAFVACSDWYYEAADTDYRKIREHNLRGVYSLNGRTLEGRIVVSASKKNRMFSAENVSFVQLDSSLAEVDTIKGEILKGDTVDYRMPLHDYKYPYVKIQVKGKWKFLGKKAVPLTLEAICDISNVWSPNVNLMTHLEVPLVETLVADEFPFNAAKHMAAQSFTENFGFEFVKENAESVDRDAKEIVPLYSFFMVNGLSDSAFVEAIEDFRIDMADGVYDDSVSLIRYADYVVQNWLHMDSIMQKLDTSELNWELTEAIVERVYGLERCNDSVSDYSYINTKISKLKGDSLVCDERENGNHVYRTLTPWERQFGACTRINLSKNILGLDDDSTYYYCTHSYYGNKMWDKATWRQVVTYYLGDCYNGLLRDKDNENVYHDLKKIYGDTVYICRHNYNIWNAYGTDTLSYFLGDCDSTTLWSLNKLRDSSEYVCTFDSWRPANNTLKFLSEQRPCDKKKDGLRSFMYDSVYYVCADVKWGEKKVYTFKDTVRAYADSIAHESYLATECASVSDTVKYLLDTLEGKYYHCKKGPDGLKFYESDFFHAKNYLSEQYIKTLPECTAKNDSLELFVHPYFEKNNIVDNDIYYHCAKVGGKYQYEPLSYDHRATLVGLADVNERYTCDAQTDSLSVVRDSIYRNYFHCEKQGGRYGFVEITEAEANSYMSYADVRTFEPCVSSDTIQYRRDAYNNFYYYYCADKGGTLEYERIHIDSLAQKLVDHNNKRDACDASVERWRVNEFKLYPYEGLYKVYYMACDYDDQDRFAWMLVSEERYNLFAQMSGAKLNPPACSAEELAARGPAVEVKNGSITDPRDGRKYRVATIGRQTWMAENLDYYDTLVTPNLIDQTMCADSDVCAKGTRRYSWYGAVNVTKTPRHDELRPQLCTPVQGVCPVGWHIPSMMEWQELFDYTEKNKGSRDYGIGVRNASDKYYAVSEAHSADDKINSYYGVNIPYSSGSYKYVYLFYSRSYSVRCVKD